jgi:hypothetical protein
VELQWGASTAEGITANNGAGLPTRRLVTHVASGDIAAHGHNAASVDIALSGDNAASGHNAASDYVHAASGDPAGRLVTTPRLAITHRTVTARLLVTFTRRLVIYGVG